MNIFRDKNPKLKWEYMRWLLYFLFAFAGSLIIWYFAMSEQVLKWLTSNIDTPAAFLEIHGYWYLALMILTALNLILTMGFGIKALIFYIANHDNPKYADYRISVRVYNIPITDYFFIILFLSLELFTMFVFITVTDPYGNYRSCMEDAEAVNTGNLITLDVFLDADHERGSLTQMGPNYHELLMEYHVTDTSISEERATVYVPDYLSFTADQGCSYNRQNGYDWNRHHATIYRITYTPNYRLVTSIEVIRMGTVP